jgi:hypothetical protein
MNVTQIGGGALEINGRRVEFEQPIEEYLELEDRVIILFEPMEEKEFDPDFGRNVFAFDETGKQLWRIQDSGFTIGSHRDDDTEVRAPYTGIGLEQDGRITVGQPIGCEFDVNPETGEISNMVLGK